MPDLDIISRTCPPNWRAPMRLFLSDEEPQEVARSINGAMAASLRDEGGVPGFHALCEVLRARMNASLDAHSAYTHVDRIEHHQRRTRHAEVAGRAVKGLLARMNHGEHLTGSLETVVARAFCLELLSHALFGLVRPESIGKHFPGRREAEAREEACRRALEPSLRRFAERVAEDPSCDGLRAPRISREGALTTEELLDQPVI